MPHDFSTHIYISAEGAGYAVSFRLGASGSGRKKFNSMVCRTLGQSREFVLTELQIQGNGFTWFDSCLQSFCSSQACASSQQRCRRRRKHLVSDDRFYSSVLKLVKLTQNPQRRSLGFGIFRRRTVLRCRCARTSQNLLPTRQTNRQTDKTRASSHMYLKAHTCTHTHAWAHMSEHAPPPPPRERERERERATKTNATPSSYICPRHQSRRQYWQAPAAQSRYVIGSYSF